MAGELLERHGRQETLVWVDGIKGEEEPKQGRKSHSSLGNIPNVDVSTAGTNWEVGAPLAPSHTAHTLPGRLQGVWAVCQGIQVTQLGHLHCCPTGESLCWTWPPITQFARPLLWWNLARRLEPGSQALLYLPWVAVLACGCILYPVLCIVR